jgi:GNAT superfamily N-acetyltransferase
VRWRIWVLSLSSVETAREEDLPEIAAMRVAEEWAENRWLVRAVHGWESGRFFVVRAPQAERTTSRGLLAVTSAVAYGPVGFIGNVVVRSSARRRGLGSLLMGAANDWLSGEGVQTVDLDATVQGRPLYARLGFRGTAFSWVLWTPVRIARQALLHPDGTAYSVEWLDAQSLPRIAGLDRAAFGGDRMGLLRLVLGLPDTRAYLARDAQGNGAGYLFVRVPDGPRAGLRLGPWIAQTPGAASALLAHVLAVGGPPGHGEPGTEPYLHACIPGASQTALGLFANLGLTVIQDDLRMRLNLAATDASQNSGSGEAVSATSSGEPGRPEWVYGMLAPMVG